MFKDALQTVSSSVICLLPSTRNAGSYSWAGRRMRQPATLTTSYLHTCFISIAAAIIEVIKTSIIFAVLFIVLSGLTARVRFRMPGRRGGQSLVACCVVSLRRCLHPPRCSPSS